MAQFCSCGSIIIDGQCTNKSCKFRQTADAASHSAQNKQPAKASRKKKTSKCITYKLDDPDSLTTR